MATDLRLKEGLPEITEAVVATYTDCKYSNHLGHKPLPNREVVNEVLTDLMDILYPGYWRRQNLHMGNVEYHVGDVIDGLHDKLTVQIARVLRHDCDQSEEFNTAGLQYDPTGEMYGNDDRISPLSSSFSVVLVEFLG